MTTAYFSPPECRLHDMGPGHPESPKRIAAIHDHLLATGVLAQLAACAAPLATLAHIERAHDAAYVAQLHELLQGVARTGRPHSLDPDTTASAGTLDAVLRSVGAAVAATEAVFKGDVANAFCAVRPPGHHATRARAMGFCFVNTVVVAARHALEVLGLQRVAIIDFDVHHGNGTEDIIADDARMLMCGIFQHPFYPGSGSPALGDNMVNIPVPAGTPGTPVRAAIERLWLPRLEAFKPQMLFISAGFDAHREDDLGQLGLVEADYAWMTRRIMDVAARHAHGRIVSCLEGGYNLSALARSVAAHLRVLSASA